MLGHTFRAVAPAELALLPHISFGYPVPTGIRTSARKQEAVHPQLMRSWNWSYQLLYQGLAASTLVCCRRVPSVSDDQ